MRDEEIKNEEQNLIDNLYIKYDFDAVISVKRADDFNDYSDIEVSKNGRIHSLFFKQNRTTFEPFLFLPVSEVGADLNMFARMAK